MAKIIFLKEQGIAHPLKQFEISHGMFRAFSSLKTGIGKAAEELGVSRERPPQVGKIR